MIVSFPSPVLSMSSDAVRQLDAGDALPGLWTLFTKCKSSLQDGRRLENISWRLWYREIAAVHYAPPTPKSVSPALSEKSGATADSPFSIPGELTHRTDDHSMLLASSPLPHTRETCPPQIDDHYIKSFSLSFGHPRSIGNIICDILPHQILPPIKRASTKGSLPTPTSESFPKTTPATLSAAGQAADHVIPAIQLPSTSSYSEAPCPHVVVVDPTPNPSPHPTPPTTPVIPETSRITISHVPMMDLLPPPLPLPALKVASAKAPITSSLTASRPAQLPLPPRPADCSSILQKSSELDSLDGNPALVPPRPASDRTSSTSSSRKAAPGHRRLPQNPPPRPRKGKDVTRHGVRPRGAHNGRPPQIRRAATLDGKTRPTFNIGSLTSPGTKAENVSAIAADAAVAPPVSSSPKAGNPPRRRVVVASTSSEYETTDTDDESWAEDETSFENSAKATKEEVQLRDAALEVKRLREMFTKIPKRSYSNLNRTRSGLLTQLLNPSPEIFPPNHPYWTSFSTQDLSKLPQNDRSYMQPVLHTSKSAAALPLAAPVTAQSGSAVSHGYQSRGRPPDQEMEDDSDSGDENSIQVSRSIAQERLAALVGRQCSSGTSTASASSAATLATRRTSMPLGVVPETVRSDLQQTMTTPIPLCHPYNLPAPALPSTPRTTRRQMLQTELSESLRRNLLWERQVSKANVMAGMRRQSSGGPIGGLRPLTALNGDAVGEKQQQQCAMVRHRSWADDYHSKGW